MKDKWKNINWKDIKVGDTIREQNTGYIETVVDIDDKIFHDSDASPWNIWNRYDRNGNEIQYELLVN